MLRQYKYLSFFIGWFNEIISAMSDYTMITSTASFAVGMFIYIDGMINDMKLQMISIEHDPTHSNKWLKFVREIQFHNGIIK